RRVEGEPPYRVLHRHDLLLAHPVAEKARGVADVGMELHVRAAVGQPDDRVRRAEDLRHRLGVHVDLAKAAARLDRFLEGRSRKASTGCLPCALAMSAMCLPASPRFFASLGSSTTMRSQRFENVESGPSGASTSARSLARIAGSRYARIFSASGPWRIGSH